MNVSHLLATYGYSAVFLLVLIECLGVPLPGETILVAAGIYAGTTHKLSILVIFLVAAAAAVLGDNIGFWIGDRGGIAFCGVTAGISVSMLRRSKLGVSSSTATVRSSCSLVVSCLSFEHTQRFSPGPSR